MSSIYLWMRREANSSLVASIILCFLLTSGVWAETNEVRLGVHFQYATDQPYSRLGTVSELREELKINMQRFIAGFDDCPDIVEGDLKDGVPRDNLRDTWTVIQSFRVECWTSLQFDPSAPVAPTVTEDRLTPQMIHGIMANAERLSLRNPEMAKVLLRFSNGSITCKDKERCELASPEVGEWVGYSLYMDLLLVRGDDWFVRVVQAYQGREGFVYGVHWRAAGTDGKVVSIFPIFD